MRRDRTLQRTGWRLTRSCFLSALALVGVVNLLYVWPGKLGVPSLATPARGRVQSRKQLAESRLRTWTLEDLLTVHLVCGDNRRSCTKQRHAGKCSTHLLQDFHVCMHSCGVCPALELALREAMNLTHQQLVVLKQAGPPPCKDDVDSCPDLVARAATAAVAAAGGAAASREPGASGTARCAGVPLALVGSCKATCGACQPTTVPKHYVRVSQTSSASGGAGTGGDDDAVPDDEDAEDEFASSDGTIEGVSREEADDVYGDRQHELPCYDSVNMCGWWAANEPRVCERAAEDLHRWWWVPVACRRSCGLCNSTTGSADAAVGGSGQNVTWTAALAAAARLEVQVGEALDGTPRVAVFEALASEPGDCADKQAQCDTWAASGECARNRGFMAEACPKSCGACPDLVNLPQPLAKVRLNNGVLMPTVGYGCAGLGGDTAKTVRWALDAGYRHLDSAQAREWYREDLVGEALQGFLRDQEQHRAKGGRGNATAAAGGGRGGVRREDIFVTSKLHPRHLGYFTTMKQFNHTLKDLHSPYVDLFLLHYAECWGDLCGGVKPEGTFFDSWRALERIYKAGLARAIGVSNFSPEQLTKLLAVASVRPAVLQVHVDPLGRNEAEQALCRREGITLTAYSTLGTQWGGAGAGGNPVLGHPRLKALGQEVGGRSAAQVALRWALQQGLVVLPRSSNAGRMRQNLQLYGWGLEAGSMLEIAHLRPVAGGGS